MKTEYTKWELGIAGAQWIAFRFVSVRSTLFGFQRVTEREERINVPNGVHPDRLCRALNNEPEPEVKLSDHCPVTGRDIFSTESLKAELARREGSNLTATTSNGICLLTPATHTPKKVFGVERRVKDRRKKVKKSRRAK